MRGYRLGLVCEAIQAAVESLPRPHYLEEVLSGRPFDLLCVQSLASCSTSVRDCTLNVKSLAREAVQMTRNRHRNDDGLKGAHAHLTEAVRLSHELNSNAVAQAHTTLWTCAARAYLLYAERNWNESQANLIASNNAALTLIDQGESWIHLLRVQLLHNWARIHIASGAHDAGLAMACTIIDHLHENEPQGLPMAGPWISELVASCPIEMIAALAFQVAGEANYWKHRLGIA